MSTITLFDLPSRGRCACWSLNPWKTRLALNFKGLPYKTEWVEYPDIAPKFKGFGIGPNKEGMAYTIPAAHIPDASPEYQMDSKLIATTLEKLHPSPPMHLDSPIVPKVEAIIPKIMPALTPNIMPKIPRNVLNEKSQGYFEETREKRFGMPLSQLEKEKGGEKAYEAASGPLKELAALLNETKGPFFMGDEVSYSDFIVAGFFQFTKCADEEVFQKVMSTDPSFPKLYEASKPWLERDAH